MLLDLLEDFTGEDDDRGGTVANFGVLRSCNVDENAGGGMNNVEELSGVSNALLGRTTAFQAVKFVTNLHNGSTIVSNGLPAILIYHKQIATIGSKGRLYRALDSETGIDVGDDLSLALGRVGAWRREPIVSQRTVGGEHMAISSCARRCLDCVWFCVWQRAVG